MSICVNYQGEEFESYGHDNGIYYGVIDSIMYNIIDEECCNIAGGTWHGEDNGHGGFIYTCINEDYYCHSTPQSFTPQSFTPPETRDAVETTFTYLLGNIQCLNGVLVGESRDQLGEFYTVGETCCGRLGGTWNESTGVCECRDDICLSYDNSYDNSSGISFNEEVLHNIECVDGWLVGYNNINQQLPVNNICCDAHGGDWVEIEKGEYACQCSNSGTGPNSNSNTDSCDQISGYTIALSTDDANGSLFNVDGDEVCCLNVQYDFLIEFNCAELFECATISGDCDTISILENLVVSSHIQVNSGSGWAPLSGSSHGMIDTTTNLASFLDGNLNTGLLITGGTNCDAVNECIIDNLCGDCGVVSANTFNSNWVHVDYTICDEDSIAQILNNEIKLGFDFNKCACNYSLLLDNIELNKNCTTTFVDDVLINTCPGFELRREIDNKKSWVNLEGFDRRDYDLIQRDTHYDTNHERLVINTKEIDLTLDAANTIECAVFEHFLDFDCSLNYIIDNGDRLFCDVSSSATTTTGGTFYCSTGVTTCNTGTTTPVYQTINDILTTKLSAVTDVQSFIEIMLQELVDVKDRKVLQSYPTVRWLYEAYLTLVSNCPSGYNQYTYCDINQFIGLVNGYWYELFEQVVPSTTIWGSTTVYRNSVFDQQKFQYKRYSLFTCEETGPCDLLGCANTNNDISDVPFPVIMVPLKPIDPIIPIFIPNNLVDPINPKSYGQSSTIASILSTGELVTFVPLQTENDIFTQSSVNLTPDDEADMVKTKSLAFNLLPSITTIGVAFQRVDVVEEVTVKDGVIFVGADFLKNSELIKDINEPFDVGVGVIGPSGPPEFGSSSTTSGVTEQPLIEPCTHPCAPHIPTVIHCDGLSIYNMDDGSSFVGNITNFLSSDGGSSVGECDLNFSTEITPEDPGYANGSVTINLGGYGSPWDYSLTDEYDVVVTAGTINSSVTISGLSIGTYIVSVTDSYNCSDNILVHIPYPTPPTGSTGTTECIIVSGFCDSGDTEYSNTISVSGASSTLPYNYTATTEFGSFSASGIIETSEVVIPIEHIPISGGTFSFYVIDSEDCSTTFTCRYSILGDPGDGDGDGDGGKV